MTTKQFWLVFAALVMVAAACLVLFSRVFGPDTPETRRKALAVMRVVYTAILLIGGGFLHYAFSQDEVQPRIAVQALIFMMLGFGGLMVGRGGRDTTAGAPGE